MGQSAGSDIIDRVGDAGGFEPFFQKCAKMPLYSQNEGFKLIRMNDL